MSARVRTHFCISVTLLGLQRFVAFDVIHWVRIVKVSNWSHVEINEYPSRSRKNIDIGKREIEKESKRTIFSDKSFTLFRQTIKGELSRCGNTIEVKMSHVYNIKLVRVESPCWRLTADISPSLLILLCHSFDIWHFHVISSTGKSEPMQKKWCIINASMICTRPLPPPTPSQREHRVHHVHEERRHSSSDCSSQENSFGVCVTVCI